MTRGIQSITYCEQADDEKPRQYGYPVRNQLTIETISTPGGGKYAILKTKRWAFDEQDIPWLLQQLQNALKQEIPL